MTKETSAAARNEVAGPWLSPSEALTRFAPQQQTQRPGERDVEHLYSLAEDHQFALAHNRGDYLNAERCVAEHVVGSGSLDGVDVALVSDTSEDACLRVQPTTVDCEVYVRRVIVGREQNRRRLLDPG